MVPEEQIRRITKSVRINPVDMVAARIDAFREEHVAELRLLREQLAESNRLNTALLKQIAANTAPNKPARPGSTNSPF